MWHRKRWFGGGWFIWVFFFLFLSGALGKSGVPGFVIPMIFLWVFLPMFFGTKHSHRRRGPVEEKIYRPAVPVQQPQARTAAEPLHPAPSVVVDTRTRGVDHLPAHCKSCGGPVDETTVQWRGSSAACGFCGTGLRSQGR